VTFDAGGSTDNRELETIQWDVDDDGSYERTGLTAARTFQEPGEYTVRLRVWDESSNYDTDTVTVTVAAPSTATATPTTVMPTTAPGTTTVSTPPTNSGSTTVPAPTDGQSTEGPTTTVIDRAAEQTQTTSGTVTDSTTRSTPEQSTTSPGATTDTPIPGGEMTTTSGPGFGFVVAFVALALLVGLVTRRTD
jgi:PGF-CTERM protein